MIDDVLDGYAAVSDAWVARSEAISPERLYTPVADLFPRRPLRVADIGAGTGRDAAWLADQGHRVVAVEPVARLRCAGAVLHADAGISWLDDRLPELGHLAALGPFDLMLVVGVWQHLADRDRPLAMSRLAEALAPGGLMIMALRHGPGAPGRPVTAIRSGDTVALASANGLGLLRKTQTASIQPQNRALGVHWTWLAITRPDRSCLPPEIGSGMNNGMA